MVKEIAQNIKCHIDTVFACTGFQCTMIEGRSVKDVKGEGVAVKL